jgi:hypothetical protein
MRQKLIAAAGLACLGACVLVTTAQAAPLTLLATPTPAHNQSLAEPVGYRNYCYRWRKECAERWPARGWRYRRCLSFHGCL